MVTRNFKLTEAERMEIKDIMMKQHLAILEEYEDKFMVSKRIKTTDGLELEFVYQTTKSTANDMKKQLQKLAKKFKSVKLSRLNQILNQPVVAEDGILTAETLLEKEMGTREIQSRCMAEYMHLQNQWEAICGEEAKNPFNIRENRFNAIFYFLTGATKNEAGEDAYKLKTIYCNIHTGFAVVYETVMGDDVQTIKDTDIQFRGNVEYEYGYVTRVQMLEYLLDTLECKQQLVANEINPYTTIISHQPLVDYLISQQKEAEGEYMLDENKSNAESGAVETIEV